MSRRRQANKRPVLPDPRHGSTLISSLINMVMFSGKKICCSTCSLYCYRKDGREIRKRKPS
jgi:small subunit ribosomal protein S7